MGNISSCRCTKVFNIVLCNNGDSCHCKKKHKAPYVRTLTESITLIDNEGEYHKLDNVHDFCYSFFALS